MSFPQPPHGDPTDKHLDKLLSFHYEDRQRLYEGTGQIEHELDGMMQILLGKNSMTNLIALRLDVESNKVTLDVSGWTDKNSEFLRKARVVDRSMSLLLPIYLHIIKTLSKADEVKNVQVQPTPAINVQGYQQEKKGLLEGFKSFVDNLKPKWKQDYQHGMSIVSSLFDDFNNAKIKWEEYRSQHWQNVAKVLEFVKEYGSDGAVPAALVGSLMEELEALDDVTMRIMRMQDAGSRILQMDKSSQLVELTNAMVATKTNQLQQASMMAPSFPSMQTLPQPSNSH